MSLFHAALRHLLLASLLACLPAAAQEGEDRNIREIIEAEHQARKLAEEKTDEAPGSLESMSTPLDSILGLREALLANDFQRAGQFLDMRYLPEAVEAYEPATLVRALSNVWRQQNIVDLSALSDSPEGNLNDGLPRYRDLLGHVTTSTGDVPIYLQRVPDDSGKRVWKISNASVAQIPMLWDELGYSPVAVFLATHLPDFHFLGMDNWQLIATVLIVLLAWPLATLASGLLSRVALLIPNRFPLGIKRFFRVSFRIFLFIFITRWLIGQLGLSLTARIMLESSGLDYFAFTVLLLGLMSLVRDYNMRRLEHLGHTQYVALLRPLTTMLKVVAVVIIALVWAENAGYDMTTILAGLGVGSLAVALAAQKTMENIIGAVTLYTARPVNPGDLCRFGNIVGRVEEIGLRSTTIRTLDRSLMVVPNSMFSSTEIENISARDRIRYYNELRLQLISRPAMEALLASMNDIFKRHEKVVPDTLSLRFARIEDATAVLRIDAGIATTDFQEFLAVAEELNLQIVDCIEASDSRFTGPGQMMQVAQIEESAVQHVPESED
ncbi:mechanosensitive ion channel family protein [Parahaliea mediterranea]|uniref:Mechanosensitive ion channel n=1 Tax=Parahaliea mediterranea TaxID=651086 RepID=A0A939DGM9_9GAMM|nr:mechanosensitive ion channel domain-containing protein [Parahaliea mediterranea]MBN7797918.1 mechanosensitive ion channel [Parahaliea mediterranea]